ncbi:glycosyl hydrolase [Paenibacillus sp. FSL H8-0548]|uniref:glycoside hydrolase family 30 protein n=1 Tax=Paenibacillus sp. FSL H8-0548 TaxID=1920422 RepID=UPI00096EE1BF|nr:glycoside hydrolase family 30 beta sandwich domain-containing protein [Paenibacillus sp. FSL H8-0548]OMF30754.1 glycosyl hydrolase [Paenibacillus sp. FSL H8-0548]
MSASQIKWISSTPELQWSEQMAPSLVETGEKLDLAFSEDRYQHVEGFGGCFNELGYVALQQLSDSDRNKIIHDLFHPEGAHRFAICRLPIGASDYALEWYSHNETDGDLAMNHFSIERDQKYLIPYIKEALKQNPNLKLFASPWSPPTWMKSPRSYNYGTLRWEKDILEAYALYFVKFVQAYREEGITIHQVHVQNEVVADQKFPSCVWTGEQLREFIRDYLGPAFEKHGLDTEIWLGTINAPEPWDEWMKKKVQDHSSYAHTVLSDPDAYKYVKGVGYQWAGKYGIQRTVMSYPELRYMQTENECGDGENTWFYAKYVFTLYQHYFTNGVNAYIYWNMALEPKGRSTWGWEQNAMITVDPHAKKAVYNPEYYVMKHFANAVEPGAYRIGVRGPWTGNAVAFETVNGDRVMVVGNPFSESRIVRIANGDKAYAFELQADSFNTIIFKQH